MDDNLQDSLPLNTNQFNILLNGYEGPIDLLLELAKKQKVDLKKSQKLNIPIIT